MIKKFVSMATAAILLATGFSVIAAAPANATAPVIASTSTITAGQVNPTLVITTTSTFRANPSHTNANFSIGTGGGTSLSYTGISLYGNTITIELTGTARPGTLVLTASSAAFDPNPGASANTLEFIVAKLPATNGAISFMQNATVTAGATKPMGISGGNGDWTQATNITWSPALTADKFGAGVVYTATVGIAPSSASFEGLSSSFFTFVGATSVSATYSGNPRTDASVTIVFPATAGTAPSGSSAGLTPLFSSGSSLDGRYTVQVSNYDSAYTYAVTSTTGQASISSSGLVTVTGLSKDQAVSVTVTTTRSGYSSGSGSVSGRSQVAPMTPSDKPTVTLGDTLITCTIGSYSATPTSSAFSLFVDGKHVSTIFSALGDYLPDWIIPWATTSTITRTATLTSASWSMNDAYKGKAITCSTLAYSKNAIGFTASQVMVAR